MRSSLLLSFLAAGALTACAVGPDYKSPKMDMPKQFMGAPSIDTRKADADWWRGFDDPELVALVDKAVANNTDLAQARARIGQSRAAAQAAGAALLPTLSGNASMTGISQSNNSILGAVGEALHFPRDAAEFGVGTSASWEIDVAGGLRRGREAADADYGASIAAAGGVALTVAAETADAYLALRALQVRLAIALDQEKAERDLVALVRQRNSQGLAAERELNRSIAELESVRAMQAPLRAAIAAQLNRLDVLVGEVPGANRTVLACAGAPQGACTIPEAPLPSGSDEPADLLRRRPDVIVAERRLAASNARIGVAVAEYYPHISLSGLVGFVSLTTPGLFTGDSVQAMGGPALRWRLFDFGRVDAEVAQAKGKQAEALAAWRGSVLKAAEDVETALARFAEANVERDARSRQLAALTKARDQTRRAYEDGVAALIDVLDADRERLSASDRLATVEADQARAAVAAYRALGGGWQPEAKERLARADGPSK